jgi:succinyl-CoA synthetase alpha subunit
MSILINKNTKVLIQGITGAEGSRACREMIEYGTKILAGVRPGASGEFVEGVPVYDTVEEALKHYPQINTSLIIVPAKNVKDAALESIFAGVPLINILTEYVPPIDSSIIVAWARKYKTRIVGPSSIGIISPGKSKVGSIGSAEIRHVFKKGSIGVISKSGGMTAELAVVLGKEGLGESTVVGIGADTICGSDFVDILELFEKDKQTKAVVIFGEVGGVSEERVAEYVKKKKIKKPIVALIGGKFTHLLPSGTVLGHAGAIVSHGKGGYNSKIKALKESGIVLAQTPEEIPFLLKKMLQIK